jgi:hypothetical protein
MQDPAGLIAHATKVHQVSLEDFAIYTAAIRQNQALDDFLWASSKIHHGLIPLQHKNVCLFPEGGSLRRKPDAFFMLQ